jgi:hypothetical protein
MLSVTYQIGHKQTLSKSGEVCGIHVDEKGNGR